MTSHHSTETATPDATKRYPSDLIGFLNGMPVARSALAFDAGVAGIYAVGTIPSARGKGIGRAMTVLPLLEARRLGYRVGILQASHMGYSLYQMIGFKKVCRYRLYVQSA
jgi:GNAT superfamily N-acetyltransferase